MTRPTFDGSRRTFKPMQRLKKVRHIVLMQTRETPVACRVAYRLIMLLYAVFIGLWLPLNFWMMPWHTLRVGQARPQTLASALAGVGQGRVDIERCLCGAHTWSLPSVRAAALLHVLPQLPTCVHPEQRVPRARRWSAVLGLMAAPGVSPYHQLTACSDEVWCAGVPVHGARRLQGDGAQGSGAPGPGMRQNPVTSPTGPRPVGGAQSWSWASWAVRV